MKVNDFNNDLIEVGDLEPCPFCGRYDEISITSRSFFEDLVAEHGQAILTCGCDRCNVEKKLYPIPGNNYDFGLGRLIAEWNQRMKGDE